MLEHKIKLDLANFYKFYHCSSLIYMQSFFLSPSVFETTTSCFAIQHVTIQPPNLRSQHQFQSPQDTSKYQILLPRKMKCLFISTNPAKEKAIINIDVQSVRIIIKLECRQLTCQFPTWQSPSWSSSDHSNYETRKNWRRIYWKPTMLYTKSPCRYLPSDAIYS